MSGDDRLTVSLDVSAVPATAAGAGQYLMALSGELAARPELDLVVWSRRGDEGRWRRALGGDGGERRVEGAAPSSRPARLLWEQTGLPLRLARRRPDVHHGPHYTAPLLSPVPSVVTVHDCTYFDHPEWHEPTKVLLFRRAIAHAARHADAVICVSEATKAHLAAVTEVRAPVFVAPHGVDLGRFSPTGDEAADRAELGGLGLAPGVPFVLFVGTLEPRKGVASLVWAFARVAEGRDELLLVLAGHPGWHGEELASALGASGLAHRVRRTGYVTDRAVPALLRSAAVVAYPSLAEGYGLPALEALACGAPLVTTEGTAMAEMAEGAALLVAPGDEAALAGALERVLDEDPALTAARRRQGFEVARRHTWAESARRHLEAYRQAASKAGRRGGAPGAS